MSHFRRREERHREMEKGKRKRKEHRSNDWDFQGERGEAEKRAVCINKRKNPTESQPRPLLGFQGLLTSSMSV